MVDGVLDRLQVVVVGGGGGCTKSVGCCLATRSISTGPKCVYNSTLDDQIYGHENILLATGILWKVTAPNISMVSSMSISHSVHFLIGQMFLTITSHFKEGEIFAHDSTLSAYVYLVSIFWLSKLPHNDV